MKKVEEATRLSPVLPIQAVSVPASVPPTQ